MVVTSILRWGYDGQDLVSADPSKLNLPAAALAAIASSHCNAPGMGGIDGHLSFVKTIHHLSSDHDVLAR